MIADLLFKILLEQETLSCTENYEYFINYRNTLLSVLFSERGANGSDKHLITLIIAFAF